MIAKTTSQAGVRRTERSELPALLEVDPSGELVERPVPEGPNVVSRRRFHELIAVGAGVVFVALSWLVVLAPVVVVVRWLT